MVLNYDATTGTHTFSAPDRPYVSPTDAFGRTAIIGSPVTKPIGPAHFTQPQPVKNHKQTGYEVVSFQVKFYDSRGTWQQEAPFDMAHCNFADCEMVGDGPYVMRHPFKVNDDDATSGEWVNPANLTTVFYRMVWAYFAGTLFATMGILDALAQSAPVMYAETTTTNPVMAKVATYAPNAGSVRVACMAVIRTDGASRLWVGYDGHAGAALGVEAFASSALTAPTQVDVSNGKTGGATAVSGILQAPNGDVLVATNDGDLRLAPYANPTTGAAIALGSLTFTNVQSGALGYYPVAVGNCALSNYAPGALWWCGDDNSVAGSSFANSNFADVTPKGRLVLTSYDGLQLDPIDFPDLPFVTFATIYRGGVCACDRKAHYWYTGRRMIAMDGGADRVADSHKTRLCCGHAVVNDKLVIAEVEIDDRFVAATPDAVDADGNNYHTTVQFLEFDPYREQMRPISKRFDLGFGGQSLVVGAVPSIPFSPNTRNVHIFSIFEGLLATRNQDFGQWLRQFQPSPNKTGYAERSTDEGNVGGQEYDDDVTYTSAYFTHPALDGFEYTPIRLIGPRVNSLLQGGVDASVDIAIGGYAGVLKATEPVRRYPMVKLGNWQNGRTWSEGLQLELVSHLGSGVTHKTTNVWPMTVEVVARRPILDGIRL